MSIQHDPLLPCPFCGGDAELHYKTWANPNWDKGSVPHLNPRVECTWCGAETATAITTIRVGDETWQQVWEAGVKEAVENWNRRTTEKMEVVETKWGNRLLPIVGEKPPCS